MKYKFVGTMNEYEKEQTICAFNSDNKKKILC